MPSRAVVDEFIAMVESGRFIEAMERFYAEDAIAQENNEPPREGLPALLAHERKTLATFGAARAEAVRPIFVEGEHVVINWRFEFDHPAGGTVTLDELVRQEWRGDRLVRERFYYDPRQLRAG